MLVPAVGVRVFAGVRGAFEGVVAGDVGLRGAVAGMESVTGWKECDVVLEGGDWRQLFRGALMRGWK